MKKPVLIAPHRASLIAMALIAWFAFCALSPLFNVSIHHTVSQGDQDVCVTPIHRATDVCKTTDEFPVETESLLDHLLEHGAIVKSPGHAGQKEMLPVPMAAAAGIHDSDTGGITAVLTVIPRNEEAVAADYSVSADTRAPPAFS